jgi:hypothetical protein
MPALISCVSSAFASRPPIITSKTVAKSSAHLEELDRSRRGPAHLFLNDTDEFLNLAVLVDKHLALTEKSLARAVEPFEEDHDRGVVHVGVKLQWRGEG